MIRVSVYTRGHTHAASYYRILQYTDKMKIIDSFKFVNRFTVKDSIYVKYLNHRNLFWKILYHFNIYVNNFFNFLSDLYYKPDIIIILRAALPKVCFFPVSQLYKILLKNSYVIWDFDDNIFEINEITSKEKKLLEQYSNKIVVSGQHLKNLLSINILNKVTILPTTDGDYNISSLDEINSNRKKSYDHEISLIWVASSSGLKYLNNIMPVLETAANIIRNKYCKSLKLIVICNKPVQYEPIYLTINNITWSRDIVLAEMLKAHIGIMPLLNIEKAKGKSGFKIIQYMATGLPSIASDIGYNKNVIDNYKSGILVDDIKDLNSWVDAIVKLSVDYDIWKQFSVNAYMRWKNQYSFEYNYHCWSTMLLNYKGENK